MNKHHLILILFFLCRVFSLDAQNNSYVPCQEMPSLMENYKADFNAINKFYTPLSNARGNQRNDNSSSPEKRERLNSLNRQYLQKLEQLDFNSLPQECKADYILFKRDLNENTRKLAIESDEYDSIKSWLPFADSIFALEKLRRRGQQVNAEKLAKDWFDM